MSKWFNGKLWYGKKRKARPASKPAGALQAFEHGKGVAADSKECTGEVDRGEEAASKG